MVVVRRQMGGNLPQDWTQVLSWCRNEFRRCVDPDLPDSAVHLAKCCLLVALEEEAARSGEAPHPELAELVAASSATWRPRSAASASTWSGERLEALAAEVAALLDQQLDERAQCRTVATTAVQAEGVEGAGVVAAMAPGAAESETRQALYRRYPVQTLAAVNTVLFDRHGYMPCNRYGVPSDHQLSSVLERGVGASAALSILYLEVCDRLGFPLAARPLEDGRYFVLWPVDAPLTADGQRFLVDPYGRGGLLLLDEVCEIFGVEPASLQPACRRTLLAALLGELRDVHWAAAVGCSPQPGSMTPLTARTALENMVSIPTSGVRAASLRRALAAAEKRLWLLPGDREAQLQYGLLLYFSRRYDDAWIELALYLERSSKIHNTFNRFKLFSFSDTKPFLLILTGINLPPIEKCARSCLYGRERGTQVMAQCDSLIQISGQLRAHQQQQQQYQRVPSATPVLVHPGRRGGGYGYYGGTSSYAHSRVAEADEVPPPPPPPPSHLQQDLAGGYYRAEPLRNASWTHHRVSGGSLHMAQQHTRYAPYHAPATVPPGHAESAARRPAIHAAAAAAGATLPWSPPQLPVAAGRPSTSSYMYDEDLDMYLAHEDQRQQHLAVGAQRDFPAAAAAAAAAAASTSPPPQLRAQSPDEAGVERYFRGSPAHTLQGEGGGGGGGGGEGTGPEVEAASRGEGGGDDGRDAAPMAAAGLEPGPSGLAPAQDGADRLAEVVGGGSRARQEVRRGLSAADAFGDTAARRSGGEEGVDGGGSGSADGDDVVMAGTAAGGAEAAGSGGGSARRTASNDVGTAAMAVATGRGPDVTGLPSAVGFRSASSVQPPAAPPGPTLVTATGANRPASASAGLASASASVIPVSSASPPSASAARGGGGGGGGGPSLALPLTVLHMDRKCPKVLAPRSGRLGDTKHLVLPSEIVQALPEPMRNGQLPVRVRSLVLPPNPPKRHRGTGGTAPLFPRMRQGARSSSSSRGGGSNSDTEASDDDDDDDTEEGDEGEEEEDGEAVEGAVEVKVEAAVAEEEEEERGGAEEALCPIGSGPGGKSALQIVVSERMYGRRTEFFRLLPDLTLELGLGKRMLRSPRGRRARGAAAAPTPTRIRTPTPTAGQPNTNTNNNNGKSTSTAAGAAAATAPLGHTPTPTMLEAASGTLAAASASPTVKREQRQEADLAAGGPSEATQRGVRQDEVDGGGCLPPVTLDDRPRAGGPPGTPFLQGGGGGGREPTPQQQEQPYSRQPYSQQYDQRRQESAHLDEAAAAAAVMARGRGGGGSGAGRAPPLLPLAVRRKYINKQQPVVIRTSSGILGGKKHLPVPPQILELLPADQRRFNNPRPVVVRVLHLTPPAGGAASATGAGASGADGDNVSYVNWREAVLEETECTIGPTGSHGCMSLQLPVTACMWNRPMLFMRLQVDGAVDLALGDADPSHPPPRKPAAAAGGGGGGGGGGGDGGGAAAAGSGGDALDSSRRRRREVEQAAAAESEEDQEDMEEEVPYGSGGRRREAGGGAAAAVDVSGDVLEAVGRGSSAKRPRWQQQQQHEAISAGGGDASGRAAAAAAAAIAAADVAPHVVTLPPPQQHPQMVVTSGRLNSGRFPAAVAADAAAAAAAAPAVLGAGGGVDAGSLAGSLDALASAAAAAARADQLLLLQHHQQQQQQQQRRRIEAPDPPVYEQDEPYQLQRVIYAAGTNEAEDLGEVYGDRPRPPSPVQRRPLPATGTAGLLALRHGSDGAAAATSAGGGGGGTDAGPLAVHPGVSHTLAPMQRRLPNLVRGCPNPPSASEEDDADLHAAAPFAAVDHHKERGDRNMHVVVPAVRIAGGGEALRSAAGAVLAGASPVGVARGGGGGGGGGIHDGQDEELAGGVDFGILGSGSSSRAGGGAYAWHHAVQAQYRPPQRRLLPPPPPLPPHQQHLRTLSPGVVPLGVKLNRTDVLQQRGGHLGPVGAAGGGGGGGSRHDDDLRAADIDTGDPPPLPPLPIGLLRLQRGGGDGGGGGGAGAADMTVAEEPPAPAAMAVAAATLGRAWNLLQQVPRAQLAAARALAGAAVQSGGSSSGPESSAALANFRACLSGIVGLLMRAREAAAADVAAQEHLQPHLRVARARDGRTRRCLLAAAPLLLNAAECLLEWYGLLAATAADGTAAGCAEELGGSAALVRAQLTEALALLPPPGAAAAAAAAAGPPTSG
ncbi:hypothetical protein VOLCADRAFT_93041 [Volvox carteri f. nagariensis]|uniref:Protein SirB1 N-terminal domain-containing protein n=1 Tax=Volvox carteri f. nagariensis TaxID=3068 RepID=D8U168_VOLCA|nr:uncharacterized protein VOLCADRAFT_93041 [Volvox carteri f. nagariensis]EFJ46581.1 hypothetical protein VOLCADRAFT_93041 [Volvox carteri f. nagariensis]|eukprot:XP_002952438.1 hypothetical protein VOLCADRAFT_93041 [Volvox carteri f. nagariensis]